MSNPTAIRQCPGCECGLFHQTRYVCDPCWRGLPKTLSAAYNQSRTLDERRSAYREILTHFRDKKQQPELF